jgi:3',5'-cyclic-nucleotide phosphodiesterase
MRQITSLVSMSMLLMPTPAMPGQGFDVIVLGALGG